MFIKSISSFPKPEHSDLHTTLDFKNDEYISKVAKNAEKTWELIETGFEYTCTTPENPIIFRK